MDKPEMNTRQARTECPPLGLTDTAATEVIVNFLFGSVKGQARCEDNRREAPPPSGETLTSFIKLSHPSIRNFIVLEIRESKITNMMHAPAFTVGNSINTMLSLL